MAIKIRYLRGNIKVAHYEPGNGTSYRAIAVPWEDGEYQQALGWVSKGWLVVSCNTGLAYLFHGVGFLTDDYIQEHLGGLPGDYPFFGDVVRQLLSGEED